jgi:hypothetical protein
MKKTLLLTTALIGTLSVLSTAQAEVKIGAHVKTAWKSMEGLANNDKSNSGFSQERQIDFSSSGTLNNGWAYKAGFSLEQDAGETGFDGGETNYLAFTSGNTTVQIGADSAPLNGDFNIVPRAGNAMNEEIGYSSTMSGLNFNTTLKYAQDLALNKAPAGVSVLQKFGGDHQVAVTFQPRSDDKMASSATSGTNDTAVSSASGKSVMSAAYYGSPVSGLNVYAEWEQAKKNSTDTRDGKIQALGFNYSMGSVKFGAEAMNYDLATGASTDTREYGVVFKLNDNATAGIGRTVTSGKTTAGVAEANKEKINYLQIGYNLGAVGTQFSYIDADNLGYASTADSKAVVLKLNTKF